MRPLLFLLSLITGLLSPSAFAQVVNQAGQPVDQYEFRIYAQGAPSPLTTSRIAANLTVCDLVPPPVVAGPIANPTALVWDDPQRPGRVCQWAFNAPTDQLVQLPDGQHEGTVAAVYLNTAGLETPRVPFVRVVPRPAVTGVRLTR